MPEIGDIVRPSPQLTQLGLDYLRVQATDLFVVKDLHHSPLSKDGFAYHDRFVLENLKTKEIRTFGQLSATRFVKVPDIIQFMNQEIEP